jgi:hypothetical protein
MRELEAIDVGGFRKPSARCMSVLFPTPALPMTAILMSDIPLLDWGGRFTELSTDGLLGDRGGGSPGGFPSRRRSEFDAVLNSRVSDTELGDW